MTWYLTALILGLTSSLHCLGMCGPIFMAAGSLYQRPKDYVAPLMLHHAGKIISYAVLGLIMGFVGKGISLLWLQNKVMLGFGILLMFMAVGGALRMKAMDKLSQWAGKLTGRFLTKKGGGFLLGLVNGLIPCGVVYAAAVGAAATQNPVDGVLFMVFFGLGTVPALSLAGFSSKLFKLRKIPNLNLWKQIPVFILGAWLFMKGLGLGIPYISPDTMSNQTDKNCCKPGVHRNVNH